ncbi:MAG: hypothetical protein ACOCU8_00615 [Patescibacteria group bacterium]
MRQRENFKIKYIVGGLLLILAVTGWLWWQNGNQVNQAIVDYETVFIRDIYESESEWHLVVDPVDYLEGGVGNNEDLAGIKDLILVKDPQITILVEGESQNINFNNFRENLLNNLSAWQWVVFELGLTPADQVGTVTQLTEE